MHDNLFKLPAEIARDVENAWVCYGKQLAFSHLDDSANGPTGDFDISRGELSASTSSSKFLQSFLSSPASLPAASALLTPTSCYGL